MAAANYLLRELEPLKVGTLLGPAPAPLYRLKYQYRLQLILKGESLEGLAPQVMELLRRYRRHRPPWKARLTVDFNPLVML